MFLRRRPSILSPAAPALRDLTRADDAAVLDLFTRAAEYVVLDWGQAPGPATLEDFWDGAPPGRNPAEALRIAAVDGGRIEGIAEMAFGWPEAADAFVGLMLLAPQARGAGLGTAMLAHLSARARARGSTRQLVAVLDANPRGRAFWQRQGFVHVLSVPGGDGRLRHRLARPL